MKYLFLLLPFMATAQTYRIDRMETKYLKVEIDGYVDFWEDQIRITNQGQVMDFRITEKLLTSDAFGYRVTHKGKVYRIMDYLDRVTLEGETLNLIVNYHKFGT